MTRQHSTHPTSTRRRPFFLFCPSTTHRYHNPLPNFIHSKKKEKWGIVLHVATHPQLREVRTAFTCLCLWVCYYIGAVCFAVLDEVVVGVLGVCWTGD